MRIMFREEFKAKDVDKEFSLLALGEWMTSLEDETREKKTAEHHKKSFPRCL